MSGTIYGMLVARKIAKSKIGEGIENNLLLSMTWSTKPVLQAVGKTSLSFQAQLKTPFLPPIHRSFLSPISLHQEHTAGGSERPSPETVKIHTARHHFSTLVFPIPVGSTFPRVISARRLLAKRKLAHQSSVRAINLYCHQGSLRQMIGKLCLWD